MAKKNKRYIFERLGGIEKEVLYDEEISKLNVQLVKGRIGEPLIILEDWSKKKSKLLLKLHIKEAIELKAIIDSLVFDYLFEKGEK